MQRGHSPIFKTGLSTFGVLALAAAGSRGRIDIVAASAGVTTAPPAVERQIDALFSPAGGCEDRIVKEIGDAEERVLVQAFIFTSKPIAEAIIKAEKRGVRCIVIADKSQEKMTYGRLPVLKREGVTVRIDAEHATANNKIILIDDTTIMTGSFNYTKAAEGKNAENLLIIKGYSDLFEQYLDNFHRHQAHARPYKRR